MQITRTRMWGKGILTRSWKRYVYIAKRDKVLIVHMVNTNFEPEKHFVKDEPNVHWGYKTNTLKNKSYFYVIIYQSLQYLSSLHSCTFSLLDGRPDGSPELSCRVAHYTVHPAILSTFLCLGVDVLRSWQISSCFIFFSILLHIVQPENIVWNNFCLRPQGKHCMS